jgi:hypothetical protein
MIGHLFFEPKVMDQKKKWMKPDGTWKQYLDQGKFHLVKMKNSDVEQQLKSYFESRKLELARLNEEFNKNQPQRHSPRSPHSQGSEAQVAYRYIHEDPGFSLFQTTSLANSDVKSIPDSRVTEAVKETLQKSKHPQEILNYDQLIQNPLASGLVVSPIVRTENDGTVRRLIMFKVQSYEELHQAQKNTDVVSPEPSEKKVNVAISKEVQAMRMASPESLSRGSQAKQWNAGYFTAFVPEQKLEVLLNEIKNQELIFDWNPRKKQFLAIPVSEKHPEEKVVVLTGTPPVPSETRIHRDTKSPEKIDHILVGHNDSDRVLMVQGFFDKVRNRLAVPPEQPGIKLPASEKLKPLGIIDLR